MSADVTAFPLQSLSFASAITTGPDGNLWFAELGKIGRVTPGGTVTEFPLTDPGEEVHGAVAGPDGNLWFTADGPSGDEVLRVTTAGAITAFAVPTGQNFQARDIVVGPDGNLDFAVGNRIGQVTTAGDVTLFPFAALNDLSALTVGADGNLWFAEGGKIGTMTPSGAVTETPVLPPASPGGEIIEGLVAGPDGNIWFTDTTVEIPEISHNIDPITIETRVGEITPAGAITEYAIPGIVGANFAGAGPITTGPDGRLWFESFSGVGGTEINALTTSGTLSQYKIPNGHGHLGGITTGPDGNVWFTGYDANQVGWIAPDATPDSSPSALPPQTGLTDFTPDPTPTNPILTPMPPPDPTTPGPPTQETPSVAPPQAATAPAPPRLLDVRVERSKLVLTFNQAIDLAGARGPASYHLVALGPSSRPGRGRTIRVASAHVNPVAHTLTLTLGHPLAPRQTYRLTIHDPSPSAIIGTVGAFAVAGGRVIHVQLARP